MAEPARKRTFDRSLVEGPIGPAVWKIAWPTMLQNVIAGLQGVIDHAMVGHFVGYHGQRGHRRQLANRSGRDRVREFGVQRHGRARGAVRRRERPHKVNRVVYQAFLTAAGMSVVLGAIGWFAAPSLLDLINAAPAVQGRGAAVSATRCWPAFSA